MKNINELISFYEDKYYELKIDIEEDNKLINIKYLHVPSYLQGDGIGSEIINEIINYSNIENKTICLNPTLPNNENINKEKLLEFFTIKFNFTKNIGNDKNKNINQILYMNAPKPYPSTKKILYNTIKNNLNTALIKELDFDELYETVLINIENTEDKEAFLDKTNLTTIIANYITKEYLISDVDNDYEEVTALARFGAIKQLPKIGEGSDRIVYNLGNGLSLKVAKNSRGLTQNNNEFYFGKEAGYMLDNKLLPKMYETGEDYIITELVTPYKSLQKEEKQKINKVLQPLKKFTQSDWERKKGDITQVFEDIGYGALVNYDLLLGDFYSPRNWGIDFEGNPIMLDGGTIGNPNFVREVQTPIIRNERNINSQFKKALTLVWNNSLGETKTTTPNQNN